MQFYFQVNDAHLRFITAISYHPFKHEIVTGAEDGLVKFWELDTGAFVVSSQPHQGWVTSFLFWKAPKLMLSSSHDCTIGLWQGNSLMQLVYVEHPLYRLGIDGDELLLLCGTAVGLHVYRLDKDRTKGSFIDLDSLVEKKEHSDIVRCVANCDNRIFTAGFDRLLVMYDCVSYGNDLLKTSVVVRAHEAAISCLAVSKDSHGNIWVVTGSFDKLVKVWNSSGKLVHRLSNFGASIIDLCIVDRARYIWVSAGGLSPTIFDVRSGDDVSQFSNHFQRIEEDRLKLQLIKYFPEIGMVIASSSRRHLLSWRSQISSAVTRLMCGVPIDCICLSEKSPLILFCAVQSGLIMQWQKKESNNASYQFDVKKLANSMRHTVDRKFQTREFLLQPSYLRERNQQLQVAHRNKTGKRFLQLVYLEERDMLLAAAEDGIIYIFGYDVAALAALMARTRMNAVGGGGGGSAEVRINPVAVRMTELSCIQVLIEHSNVVSGIAVVTPGYGRPGYFLISCSWDQRICVWSLDTFELVARLNSGQVGDRLQQDVSSDDVVTCVDYCATHDHFGYVWADRVVFVRRFSLSGSQMSLIWKLDFADTEIKVLCWAAPINSWITASEDHLIKIWDSGDDFTCSQTINAGGSVLSVCFDDNSHVLIAAVGKEIKLFDILEERMVQVNCGHTDDIRSMTILPGKQQFASAGEDGQLLIWNSWSRPKKYSGIRYNEE